MDLGGEFCVVCGSGPPLHHDRMCEACVRERVRLVEVPVTVQHLRCARCGLDEVGGRWVEIESGTLHEDLVNRSVKIHEDARDLSIEIAVEDVDDRNTRLHLTFSAEIHGLRWEEEHLTTARRSNGVCLTCARKAGNYYEATVQLRSAGRRLDDHELEELRSELDRVISEMPTDPMFFINSEGPVQGGYDVILGSKGLARNWVRSMLKNWGGKAKETNSVVGHKDGMDVTRLTVLYRRPGYDIGDLVRFKGQLWRVSGWTNEGAMLQRTDRSEKSGSSWRDLEKLVVLIPRRAQFAVELISQDDSAGEFLDPERWTPIIVRLPYDHTGGSSIRVACVEGEWMSLPHLPIDDKEVGV